MGSVYRARHVELDAPRAIKVMRSELAHDQAFVRRFRNEALLAEGLRHPHVVGLYDFSARPEGASYIVWEYVEGETVASFLRRGARFSSAEVAELIGQVADGLAAAHRKGILHRDVSPDNIMICAGAEGDRTAKLLDFGLAKAAGIPGPTAETTGLFFGKVGFSSPEQMGLLGSEELLDERTDVFALAAVTFALISGECPFETSSLQAYVYDLLIVPESDTRRRLTERLPEPWRGPICRALARDREARPRTMAAFAGEVADAARQTPKQAPVPAQAEGSKDASAEKKGSVQPIYAAALTAAVVATAVALLIILVIPDGPSSDRAPETSSSAPGGTAERAPPSGDAEMEVAARRGGPQPPVEEEEPLVERAEPVRLAEPTPSPRRIQEFLYEQGKLEEATAKLQEAREAYRRAADEARRERAGAGGEHAGDEIETKAERATAAAEDRSAPRSPERLFEPAAIATEPNPEPVGKVRDDTQHALEPLAPPAPQLPPPPVEERKLPKKIKHVEPEYPPIARAAGVQGDVVLQAGIDAQGNVTEVTVLRSVPLLDRAAIEAVRKWKFEPATVNGVPTPAVMKLTMAFRIEP
jgi:serine/threonine-protein kinase